MTEPLVPITLDLRSMPFMPLDVVRLRDSDIASRPSAECFRAAVLLWCAAWHQVPASSLPNDEATLARYAGFGRDVKAWRKVKDGALHGFIECSDGRLYHHVIAEKANEALAKREAYRKRTANATETRRQRNDASTSERNVERNVEDDPERNDHQGKVRDTKVREKEREDSKYAFESGVIKLNERDFSNWKASFSYLDVPAELIGMSEWAGGQDNWFHAVKGLLAKRNREAKAAADLAKSGGGFRPMSGMEGII